ncbi:5-oxoprolinase subunit B [soil metagenome]
MAATVALRMEIASLGDSALVVRITNDFAAAPEESLRTVRAAHAAIEAAAIPGIVECTSAYASVGVFFDPKQLPRVQGSGKDPFDCLVDQLRTAVSLPPASSAPILEAPLREVPVCYDAEFAFDLGAVTAHTGISADQVVSLHAGSEYRVYCVGFMPGFPYLGGLPPELATPRRKTPRTAVPAGSVAIGGAQTGIYPATSPGGWNVIGRTPLRLFDPVANPPARFRPGDRVRFVAITRAQFDRAAA